MSECVVRMEMPKSCAKCLAWSICPVLNEYMSAGCYEWYEWSFEDVLNMTDDEGFTKPEDCPIICQLPEGHGRLVDADYYAKTHAGGEMLKFAKTIVPAERSET